jgi:hypothetical protein
MQLMWGAYLCSQNAAMLAHAYRTEGEIVRVERVRGKSGWSEVPVFSYVDQRGEKQEASAPNSAFLRGQKVPVVFNSERPSVAKIDQPAAIWRGPIWVIVMGMSWILIGLVCKYLKKNA